MKTELAVALIGVAGTVAGALLNSFSAELKALAFGRLNRNKDLVGRWDCSWEGADVTGKRFHIQDIVNIGKISGDRVRALADTPGVGGYRLEGRISQSSLVTLFYEGLADRRPLGGVVILKLNPIRNEMHGYWHEYGPEGAIIGGETQWKKSAASPV